jgi:hypothetical protein
LWARALVAHTWNPTYLGGWDQEDHDSRTVRAKSWRDPPISKITRTNWTGGMTQEVECLLCELKALSSNPSATKKKKKNLNIWRRELDIGLVLPHVPYKKSQLIWERVLYYRRFPIKKDGIVKITIFPQFMVTNQMKDWWDTQNLGAGEGSSH